jgi:hypothetical protein
MHPSFIEIALAVTKRALQMDDDDDDGRGATSLLSLTRGELKMQPGVHGQI